LLAIALGRNAHFGRKKRLVLFIRACYTVAKIPSGGEDMKRLLTVALFLCCTSSSFAQLTQQQKVTDFKALVGLYDKGYGPYEWKVQAFHFDLLDTQPWLEKVRSSRNDLAFYDICVRYVASLNDSHDEFTLPSLYEAWLPITADLYDGRVLIDSIDRSVLDAKAYPFAVGDEVLAVDGKSVGEWIKALRPYAVNASANPFSRDRIAVGTMLDRYQGWYTYANRVQPGDTASVLVKGQSGSVATFVLPWQTLGIPLVEEGPVPNPSGRFEGERHDSDEGRGRRPMRELAKAEDNVWGIWTGDRAPRERASATPGEERVERQQDFSALEPDHVVAGSIVPFNSRFPSFNPPPGFVLRLGTRQSDEFVSGTFPVGTLRFGFIRIPSFSPASTANALAQFQAEILFFQQNTSGLVIDVMGNGGGSICYENNLVQFLSPLPFQPIPLQLRATERWLTAFESALVTAQLRGAAQLTIDTLAGFVDEVQRAMAESRGLTQPIPYICPAFCSGSGGVVYPPATDSHGVNIAYTKPIVLLTDNFTLSAAETFAAILQDTSRATVYGMRTDGGGGNVVAFSFATGPFSEGSTRLTQSIEVRSHNVTAPGLPSAPYIENIGVQPDVVANYQTAANLLTRGQPFVSGFSTLVSSLAGP
jgi:C-terminal processing protease CtpA/Prc